MAEITVAVLTNAEGAHLDGYFTGLASCEQVTTVVLGDPSGASEPLARKVLGNKLKQVERDHRKVLADYKPGMALVSLEGIQAPPVIREALEANCHVLAEKPSCVRAEDFEPLARLADMKHRHLMLAMANRVRGSVQAAKKLIRSGQIGKIYGCELHSIADQTRLKNANYQKSWFADKARAGGGHLIWLGIHWLDLGMYLTDSKVAEVAGFTGNVGGQPLKSEDTAVMAMRFDNGSFGTISSAYYIDRGKHLHLKIWGSKGWLQMELDGGGDLLKWYTANDSPPAVKVYDGPPDDPGYTPFIHACVRASLDLNPPPITPSESLHVLKTIFTCYRAAETQHSQAVS